MGELKDKAKGIANEIAGNAKQTSDDPDTRAEGRAQERKGEALSRRGLRLLHCLSEVEQLSAAGATISGLRERG